MKKIDFFKYKQHLSKDEDYDSQILKVLKRASIPLPLNLISRLTNIPKPRLCKRLKSLEKSGIVEKSTISPVAFYKLKKAR